MTIVAFEKVEGYDNPVDAPLERLLNSIGGMKSFVTAGQSVLIKPNLLSDRTPAEAVTTHPEVVRSVIRAVRACGGHPVVADSPASAVKLEQVWLRTGFGQMCEEERTPLLNLEKVGSVAYQVAGIAFHVAKPVIEANVLINVPKVKTHVLTTLTAAVKNLYGTLPGYQKAQLHKRYPRPADFGKLLCAIYSQVRPALNIADGIIGMEGDGPAAGRPVKLGFMAASADAGALDVALCSVLGIPPAAVPYLQQAARHAPEIRWGRSPPDRSVPLRFQIPSTLRARLIPRPLVRWLDRYLWIRPRISNACVRCARCIQACPVAALSLGQHDDRPQLSPSKCIGCCCCHEICPPKAISMALSPLLNLLRRGQPL